MGVLRLRCCVVLNLFMENYSFQLLGCFIRRSISIYILKFVAAMFDRGTLTS